MALLCGLAWTAAVSPAQSGSGDTAAIGRMIRDASRALQAGNAASFLSYFDKNFGEYPVLRSNVFALTAQRQIASSIDITEITQAESGYRLRVSWLLQLTFTGDPGPVETRQEMVSCAVEKRSKSWKITDFDPVSLLRP